MTTVVDVRLEGTNLLAAVEHGEVSFLVSAPEHVSEAELETATDAAIEALVDQVERQSVVDRGGGIATDGGTEKERGAATVKQGSLGGGWGDHSVEEDRYGNAAVYDDRGELDLDATERELRKEFAHVDERLPDTFGGYRREDVSDRREGLAARYVWTGDTENDHGVRVTKVEVTIFPRGPHLRDWRVGIKEWHPEYARGPAEGTATWTHEDTPGLDEPGGAVATALAVMRGEVDP